MIKKVLFFFLLCTSLPLLSKVIAVSNQKELNTYLNNGKVTVVKFWAPWCSPCQRLNPVYYNLEKEYGNKLNFLTVNISNSPGLKKKYNAQRIPLILFFQNGKVVRSIIGAKILVLQQTVEEFIR